MVNAENRLLVEGFEQDLVELPGRGQVAAERFFDDDPGVAGATGVATSCSTTMPNAAGGMAR